jgi:ferredoxin-NADP reductase/phenylpropionate dioxygenase-like ring-hydroxylating dioxygenase large terminal subunit
MSHTVDHPESLIAALDRGESLPAHWYTDPSITHREIEHVFRKSWNYLGPSSELVKTGDFITGYAGEVPVVVIRNESGLAGFVNVCRHRRHEVMKGRGNAAMMRCGYHAWTYDLSGCLKGAPRSALEANFRLEDYPLLPMRVETLGPWVFINLDPAAEPLVSTFGKLLEIVSASGIDLNTLELYSREEWHAEANWKTMLENYLECYHCAVAHPGFSAAIDVLPENYHLGVHGWFISQVGHVRDSALAGKSAIKIYDARGEVAQAQYHLLWPNTTININPGFPNLSIDVWIPDGPNKTRGFSEQYFAPGVSEEFARELIEFNKQVGYEDDVLTNSVQKGLLGGIPDRGRFLLNSEHLCVHFQKLVVNALERGPAALKKTAQASAAAHVETTVPVIPSASAATQNERNAFVPVEVAKVEKESDTVSSFYLRRVDGAKLDAWEPGQFLPIRVTIPGEKEPLLRTFTLSSRSNPDFYRLSISRRAGSGVVSQFLHENAAAGFRLEAAKPRGKFVLDQTSARPVVLVSGGVGITPMMAIAEHLVEQGSCTANFRPIYFVHGTRSSRDHAFKDAVRDLASRHPEMSVHILYSRPGLDDAPGVTHDADGHITLDTLKKLLPFGDYDFYLCGPATFMESLYSGLIALAVRPDRIHFESFGPGTVLKPEFEKNISQSTAVDDGASVRVRFAASTLDAVWSPNKGTLLEFAEEIGLAPAFGCRSGICGTCRTPLESGAVRYLEEPLAGREDGKVLLCCSVPEPMLNRQNALDPDVTLHL